MLNSAYVYDGINAVAAADDDDDINHHSSTIGSRSPSKNSINSIL